MSNHIISYPAKGLSTQQAAKLLLEQGPNELQDQKEISKLALFISHLLDPISLVLIASAIGSGFFGEIRQALVILTMVLLSAVLDFVQEYRSSQAVKKLTSRLARKTTVVRSGKQIDIPILEIVIGDVVFLSTGDIVCADGKILESDSLSLNESALTGESLPVEKSLENDVFAGTNVLSGYGYFEVTETGSKTKLGQLALSLNDKKELNSFEQGSKDFGKLVFKATIGIISLVLLINISKAILFDQFTAENLIQTVLFAITIAVGLTPELLPVITSVNKARGSISMGKAGVLVKRLDAIPVLGSMDVLCSDKTGTLTEDKISLVRHLDLSFETSQSVFMLGYLNSHFQTGLKNTLDKAILQFQMESVDEFRKIDEIPYDFQRKRLSILVQDQKDDTWLITKGQPNQILDICTQAEIKGVISELTATSREEFTMQFQKLNLEGFRVLAVCRRNLDKDEMKPDVNLEKGMTLMGWLAFLDKPKMEAAPALKRLHEIGLHIKIITGDNELITQKVCNELDLKIKGIITGDEIDKLDDEQIIQVVEKNNIFARCNPEQKKRIILSLRRAGHVVGYMGDGINDAPSLQAADTGISVDNAVDVARESADIILLNKNLNTLLDGVEEGRKTFANTLKYMMMALSSNFGNMLSVVVAALYLPFLPMLPVQVLLNNSLYDISQLAIPTDNVDSAYLKSPHKWDIKFVQRFMIVFGGLSSIFDLIIFYLLYNVLHVSPATFQTTWFVLSLSEQILVIFVIRTRLIPFVQSWPSKWLILNTLPLIALAFAFPYLPVANDFGLVPLDSRIWIIIPFLIGGYLVSVELLKHRFYAKFRSSD